MPLSELNVVGILLTSKCNLTCRHCCNDSHPSNTGIVRFEEAARLVDEARHLPSVREIGFSGGEPFLVMPLLLRLVQHAAGFGLTSSVTSNGYWARSSRAARLLIDLKDAGLRALNLSTSVFHQAFVDLGTVVSAARLACEAGLAVSINIVATSTLQVETVRDSFRDLGEAIEFVVMPCLPTGRAATEVTHEEFAVERSFGNCRDHFRKLAVDIDGDVYPCCSPGGFTAPLRLGNIGQAPLDVLWRKSESNELLAILEAVGPGFFLPFLQRSALGPTLPERFRDQCHLCHAMLSSSEGVATVTLMARQLLAELSNLPSEMLPTGSRLEALRCSTIHSD